MSNYSKNTDFASKDALLSGDPNKIIKGTEIDDEFDAIQTAVNSKANANNTALTGVPTAPTATVGTETTQLATTAFVQQALAAIYPVGSVYTNATVNTNPNSLLGFGTWTAFGTGRVLVGVDSGDTAFDTLGETGGSKDAIVVAHTHTTADAGTHSHTVASSGESGSTGNFIAGASYTDRNISTSSAGSHSHTVNSTGSSGTNANLQPYVTVYMWKRTA